MKVRVFENPDGTLRIVHPNPKEQRGEETEEAFYGRVFGQVINGDASLQGLPYFDMEKTLLPANRAKRYAWRTQNKQIVEDSAVPEPPHPKQAILDRISSVTTIAQLKSILTEVVKG